MNQRLQRKCFIAATGTHLLLLVILFVGPAFLSSSDPLANRRPLDFVPLKTIDGAMAGGGNPNAQLPAAQPPEEKLQPPAPQPVKTPTPEPPKEAKTAKPDRTLPETKAQKTDSAFKPVVRPTNKTAPKKQNTSKTTESEADAQARAQAAWRKEIASAARSIRENVSGITTVELTPGPGGGGPSYANFLDAVGAIYDRAWIVPDGVTDDEATATASVTIARDGTVVEARIIRSSGNAKADQSVEATLRRVKFAVPLPESAKEDQRTVTIKFNVKAKRGLG
jgi:protein TonB